MIDDGQSVCSADLTYVRGEPLKCLEARCLELHDRMLSDGSSTETIVIPRQVNPGFDSCYSDNQSLTTTTTTSSSFSTLSSSSTSANCGYGYPLLRLPRTRSGIQLALSCSSSSSPERRTIEPYRIDDSVRDNGWGYFVDTRGPSLPLLTSSPPRPHDRKRQNINGYRSFMKKELSGVCKR